MAAAGLLPYACRVMRLRRWTAAVLAGAGVLVLCPGGVPAQEYVRVVGAVQWVGGTRMQVMTDAGSVAIDLRQADQGTYQTLRAGDRIIVDGVIASDRRVVIAQDIWRDSRFDFQAP
jgi:hypothetical protein